jgi:hypothetical protein
MKKSMLIFACVSLSLAVIVSRGIAEPGPSRIKEKIAVDTVLKSEHFTPTRVIVGTSNSVWFVAARCLLTNTIDLVTVQVSGQAVSVQMEHYLHTAEGWHVHPMPRSGVTDLQRKIEDEVSKAP